ncbi:Germin-like protein subfamily 2 member 4, partial [Linum perenne]
LPCQSVQFVPLPAHQRHRAPVPLFVNIRHYTPYNNFRHPHVEAAAAGATRSVHFQKNNEKNPMAVIAAFNSQLPGTKSIAATLFSTTPAVSDIVLHH